MTGHQYGDAPIEDKHREFMRALAQGIDKLLNGDKTGKDRENAFVLMIFPFGDFDGRCNYISNGVSRKDMVVLLKEQAARFEGQPEIEGHA